MNVLKLEQILRAIVAFSRSNIRAPHESGFEWFWSDQEIVDIAKKKLIEFYDDLQQNG